MLDVRNKDVFVIVTCKDDPDDLEIRTGQTLGGTGPIISLDLLHGRPVRVMAVSWPPGHH